MTRAIRVSLVVLAVSSVLTIQVTGQTGAPAVELKVGNMAPDFTLPASDGQAYTLSKLRGKSVVLAWFPKAFTAG
jgi:peroxiredoxin Q/BCP